MTADMKPEHRIVITVRPSSAHDGKLTVDDALQQVLDFLRVADEAKASIGGAHGRFDWYLRSASTNSPFTVVAVAEAKDALSADITADVLAVKEITGRVIAGVMDGQLPPAWLSPSGGNALREFFKRTENGIDSTVVNLEAVRNLVVQRDSAKVARDVLEHYAQEPDVPARTAYGEIEGRIVAIGRYRGRPAMSLVTPLYGPVWCVLPNHLVDLWGDAQKVSDVWKGKRITVSGVLYYWKGGRLSRVEVDDVREKGIPSVNIADVLDADFTAGLDPVEYLKRLHEGELG